MNRRYTSLMHILLAALFLSSPAFATTGDCNGDGKVTINELVSSVRISLGEAALEICTAADRDGNGLVSIDELVAAVLQALADRPPQRLAFVVTTNFTAGSFATVELDEPRTVTLSSSRRRIYRDAVVRTRNGLVYIVNRLFGDNLQLLDPEADFRTVFQCSTGNGSNPRDIAFAGDGKAYISLFEKAELLIVNPSPQPNCSDFVLGSIDLSTVGDADGIPDLDQMAIIGDRLYVVSKRLDINNVLREPAGPAAIAVVDINTDTLVDVIELIGENPFSSTKGVTVHGAKMYIASAGIFDVLDGGLEQIDLASGESEGFISTETQVGGDITDFVIVDQDLGYAVVSQTGLTTALITFDPTSGRRLDTIYQTDGFNIFDIELNDRGELYVADRTRGKDGVRIFDAATGSALVDGAIDLGLSPFDIVFLP